MFDRAGEVMTLLIELITLFERLFVGVRFMFVPDDSMLLFVFNCLNVELLVFGAL